MLNLKDKKNTRCQGDVGLAEAIAWFTRNNYTVCVPISDSQRYDLIVEKDSIMKRVEVKTTYFVNPHGNFVVALKTCGGNRSGQKIKYLDKNEVDILFILTEENSKYIIPVEAVPKGAVSLGVKYDMYKIQ